VAGVLSIVRKALPSAVFAIAIGTFLAFLAPYETGALGWPAVWFYWTGLIAFGVVCGGLASRIVAPFATDWPEWLPYLAVSVLVSIPIAGAVISLQTLLGTMPPVSVWPTVYLFVWVISAAVSAISYFVDRSREAGAETPSVGRALLDKLPVRLKSAEIWALESEDHYLRVHTSSGDALILMRLVDAIAAVEGLEGMQTHRSWWVARVAIEDAAVSGGRATLTLKDETQAPVSRSFYPALREAGWL